MEDLKKRGIVYLAFGYEYLLLAAHSARTAKASNPGIICELITNVRFSEKHIPKEASFDRVTFLGVNSEGNRFVKTSIVNYTDLEYGVYLDCDTEVLGSLEPAFRLLDDYDLALKHCSKPTTKEYEVAPGISSNLFPEWNGGVVFFRNNERTRQFFRDWSEIFRLEGKNRDQPALACAMYRSKWGGRLLSLNVLWNTFPADVRLIRNGLRDSRIWHYRKPEKWPAVAPAIVAMHENYWRAVVDGNPFLKTEIEEVGRRYQFLSSKLYRLAARHPRSRNAFTAAVNILMKRGFIPQFKLERDHQVAGEDYRQLGSEPSRLRDLNPAR